MAAMPKNRNAVALLSYESPSFLTIMRSYPRSTMRPIRARYSSMDPLLQD